MSDRLPRRRLLAGALGVLGASLALCALADRAWLLSLGLALAGAASGVSCAAAEAELVSSNAGSADRAMSRWMAFGAAGDVIAPLAVAAALWLGGSHRGALAAVAVLMGVQALLFWRAPPTSSPVADTGEESTAMPLSRALAQAVRKPRLWLFLFAATACTLLDEIVVALAVLRLHDDMGWSETFAAAAMTGYSLGSLSGALTTERLLARFTPRRVLVVSTLSCFAALALFISASSPFVAAGALVLLGASASPHYPLCLAAAYNLVPGKPGLVNALCQAFVWVEVVAPLVLGAMASRYGVVSRSRRFRSSR